MVGGWKVIIVSTLSQRKRAERERERKSLPILEVYEVMIKMATMFILIQFIWSDVSFMKTTSKNTYLSNNGGVFMLTS